MVWTWRSTSAGTALLGALACSIGGSVAGWKPATEAAGATIELDLGGSDRVWGELLTIDSVGFLVLEPGRLVRVGFEAVREGTAYKTSFDKPPISADTRDRLRLMSRYPQGLPPGVEQALLRAYGWDHVEEENGTPPP
jgi:hypothetical protein